MDDVSNTSDLSEMAGNSQLMWSSLILCGKKATASRIPRASALSSRNIGEIRESSIVVTKLPEYTYPLSTPLSLGLFAELVNPVESAPCGLGR